MVRLGIIGLGKMGLSHLAIARPHPDVELVGICDTSSYMLDVLGKNTGLRTFGDSNSMIKEAKPQAVIIATPSQFHASNVRAALQAGIHVFCEKPFCLNANESEELRLLAEKNRLVNQVGYHYRFVAAFAEMKRLLDLGSIGKVTHVMAEAYGPVVLRPKGTSWRSQKEEGGGCLYDYAAHPVNLLNWFFGDPDNVSGTVMNSIFSKDADDEVYSTLRFASGLAAQLSVNWSDESYRKMSVKMTATGTTGRIYADRQECQIYLGDKATVPEGYTKGWNVRYTTDLTPPVWFYVRGEEYSAQIDYFVRQIEAGNLLNINSFASAAQTDRVLDMLRADSHNLPITPAAIPAAKSSGTSYERGFLSRG